MRDLVFHKKGPVFSLTLIRVPTYKGIEQKCITLSHTVSFKVCDLAPQDHNSRNKNTSKEETVENLLRK